MRMEASGRLTEPPLNEPAVHGRSRFGAHVALLLMTVIWAVNFSVTKYALGELSPLAFNALRFALAAIVVYAILRSRGPVPLPTRRHLPVILALGLLGNAVYQLFFIYGMDRTGAGTASLLLAGTPLITALLSAAAGHERLKPRVWFGVCCTVVGIALVVAFGATTPAGRITMAGNLLMIGASVAWAMYTVGSRRYIDEYGSVPVTAWTLWIGALGIVIVGVPDLLAIDLAQISPGLWLAIAYGGMLSIGIAYLIWYHGVRLLGNTRTSIYSNLTPVLALLVAWAWLGEVPSVGQLSGAAVIVGGVTLAQWR